METDVNYQNISLSVLKNNEFRQPARDVQQDFEYGMQNTRERMSRDIKVQRAYTDKWHQS